jgi:hypothetical protein
VTVWVSMRVSSPFLEPKNMNKFLLSTAALALLSAAASAQISYSFDFNVNSTGWTGNFSRFTGTTTCGAAGGSMRRNLWSSATTGQLISPLTGTTLGGTVTITYDYKCMVWSANTVAAPTPWGSFDVQYGATAAGPWTTFATVTNEAQTSGVCLNKSHTFSAPAGPVYVRWSATWGGGDYYMNFDNVVMSESVAPCSGTPAPGNVTGAPAFACDGVNYTLGLQNATTGTGVSYQWYSSTVSNAGPWTNLGTAATQSVSQSVTTWYYCDVTCVTGPTTGASNVLQLDMQTIGTVETFETGFAGCYSNAGGTVQPNLAPVSAFGVGAQAVRFNFWTWAAAASGHLTSPVLPAPTVAGDRAYFDVAGTNYPPNLAWWDTIALQESNDGGSTWTTVVTMDNQPGGLLYTAPYTGQFTPTGSQWNNLSFALTPGTNRIRFVGTSGFGNDAYVDNVVVGPAGFARHYSYGASCSELPTLTMSAAPAPLINSTFGWTINGLPEYIPTSGLYFGILALGLAADVPGTSITTNTFGQFVSPCLVHLNLTQPFDLLLVSGGPTNTAMTFTLPNDPSLAGAELFSQTIGAQDPGTTVCSNPACLFTSNAIRSHVSTF